ncbi:Translational repressor [Komagataella phaffii CBS 7435]|uniref:Protein with a role in maintenance of cellular integrity n=2 Tax=Komagataella phaffii TaxID=460519 RepID=C4R1X0_KOMPG|nr:Protein with a role in maintenance of cellular integrity [Komagataella phaffii GS115]CAH2447966.1 Protein with a role in maintenance of cellular integrity [Komagataella phaffii CBS 7435]CAY69494.1 Protein with a role in maintenance of cellular integrity [Komagataella phaffii GS115]CCA38126.1 Translational repressor [Komagataella phaffii CBS 7435]
MSSSSNSRSNEAEMPSIITTAESNDSGVQSNKVITTTATKGNKPKILHIAHRRSPSELTSLMVEQFNLQCQLEAVQHQQQQILQQQQQQYLSPQKPKSNSAVTHGYPPSSSSNQDYNHRRSPSNSRTLGHSRRHSLGLDEAKKQAAIAQQQRSPSKLSISSSTATPAPAFKFPASPTLKPQDTVERKPSHTRSKSAVPSCERSRSPQHSFQFPPRDKTNLSPPVPSFAYDSSPSHSRRHSGSNNSSWRKHTSTSSLSSDPQAFFPGHRSKSSLNSNSISSITNFTNVNNGGNRKSLFAPYLTQASLPDLLNEGRLVAGILRVNKKNRSDAYVSTDGLLDADIFICGSKDRNRALEGDLVAVELLAVDEVWNAKREKEEKKRRKDRPRSRNSNNADIHNDASTNSYSSVSNETGDYQVLDNGLQRRGSLKQRPTQKKNDDLEVEGQSLLLVEEEEINDEYKPLYAGHVVAVIDRIPGQLFSGTLGLLRPSQASNLNKDINVKPKIVWFKPTDKKVPLIAIPTEQAPKDFVDNHDSYVEKLFVASIKRWPITSLHPFGTLISELGNMNDDNTEVDAILRDNNFLCDEYDNPDEFISDITSTVNLEESRKIFEDQYIIAASPTGACYDHALHVKRLEDTTIEFGIHISDISHYVKPGSNLDKKAKKRSHSVFLPQRETHLYPKIVNDAISMKENSKNLAISVVFKINTLTFEVDDVWIGPSVVIPKQLISYSAIDLILNDETTSANATTDYIKTFYFIAREFRRKRLHDPILENGPVLTLMDQLDDERVKLSLNIYDPIPAEAMINEIFHKVNSVVAHRIFSLLGEVAFLRRQPHPTLQKLETYVKKVNNLSIKLNTTDGGTLQDSLLQIKDENTRKVAETILHKCMPRGKYFIAGKTDPENYSHYLHNLPLYTHFTAPSRRYSDLIVHRQLKFALAKECDPNLVGSQHPFAKDLDPHYLKMNADYCNFKKDCAKAAQEQAIHLLLSQTIKSMSEESGQILSMGIVVQVYESAFDVFLPEFGIEKRVHGDQLPLIKAEFDKDKRVLELYWEKGVDSATFIPEDENEPLSYRASIKNSYRSSTADAARNQSKKMIISSNEDSKKSSLDPHNGSFTFPVTSFSAYGTEEDSVSDSYRGNDDNPLAPYLEACITRTEEENNIQEIRELHSVPVLLRAEIGMALPCLTVRCINPFA